MLTHTPFPKKFSLKLTISVHDNTRILRHLDEVKTTILTTNDDSNGQQCTIIRFTSDEIFSDKEVHLIPKELFSYFFLNLGEKKYVEVL